MKTKILKKLVPAMIAAWGLIVFYPLSGSATPPTIPKKDITFNCSVEPEPELGKEFTVTATFSLNEETYYMESPEGTAVARLGVMPRQEFISGDTILTGKFKKGESYSLTATYKAATRGKTHIGLSIKTIGEADKDGKEKIGGYTFSSLRCGFYDIGMDQPVGKEIFYDSATGVKISTVTSGTGPDDFKIKAPGKITVGGKSTETKPRRRPATEEEWLARNKKPKGIVNERRVYLEKLSDGSYQQIIDVYIPDTTIEWRIIFKDHETYEILYPDFSTTKGDWGSIKYQKDSIYIFRPSMIGDDLKIKGRINNKEFDLILNVSSSWMLDGTFKSGISSDMIDSVYFSF
jgi:hypothetical protein